MTTNKCIECGSGDAVRGLCEDCREMEYDFDFSNLYDATTDEEYKEIWDIESNRIWRKIILKRLRL